MRFDVVSLFPNMFDALREGIPGRALEQGLALGLLLLPILFYRLIAYFAGFGFPEVFARDHRSVNPPGSYALLFWILYLGAWATVFFELQLY